MITDYFRGKEIPGPERESIEKLFKEKTGNEQVYLKSGFSNFLASREFSRLYNLWPVYLRKDLKQGLWGFFTVLAYPHYQYLVYMEKKLVGYAATVPVFIDEQTKILPDEGYTWALKWSVQNVFAKKNTLCALAAVIAPELRGFGLSEVLVRILKAIGSAFGYSRLIVPVRPILKKDYPGDSLETFMERKNEAGLPLDPWLRSHVLSGGVVRNICSESIVISARKKQWEKWLSLPFEPGNNGLPGGLAPLVIDKAGRRGIYREPNVWVDYSLE